LAGVSASGVAVAIEMSPYETTLDWQESALVGLAKGYVRVDLPPPLARNRAGTVEILRDAGRGLPPETSRPGMPSTHAMYAQARNFVAAIRGDREPMCDARQAVRDLELARDYLRLFTGS
ncbi:MAG TPA: gfo/Idh/MocA family oxidoreductase, partial [Chloroflexota bacterium]|nr:gfo/Idh/MocA family oxidoreductase [Chloroflexota bacterium]